jgi:triacylglycerol lipase
MCMQPNPSLPRETVVLVHGLCGSRLDMWPLARRLRREGYSVHNWGYLSLLGRIEHYAEQLTKVLHLANSEAAGRFHLVTHSMGGIIARTVLMEQQFNRLGRFVMLAPPNQGSFVARHLSPYLNWLAPTLDQLSDAPESYVNQLGNPLENSALELGIIEARKDRVIAPGKVVLAGYRDIAQVDGHHGVLAWYPQTMKLVSNFLATGRFQEASSSLAGPVPRDASQTRSRVPATDREKSFLARR